jgi:hypothetical protein
MLKKFLLACLLLAVAEIPLRAQDNYSYWFRDCSCRSDGYFPASQFTVFRDYFINRRTMWPWQTDVNNNPGPTRENALGVQLFQKPRFVLWLQPVERLLGFELFFDF